MFTTKAVILTSLGVSDYHVRMHNSKSGADIGAPRTLDACGIPELDYDRVDI